MSCGGEEEGGAGLYFSIRAEAKSNLKSAAGYLEDKEIGGVGCFVECEVIAYSVVNDVTMDTL